MRLTCAAVKSVNSGTVGAWTVDEPQSWWHVWRHRKCSCSSQTR